MEVAANEISQRRLQLPDPRPQPFDLFCIGDGSRHKTIRFFVQPINRDCMRWIATDKHRALILQRRVRPGSDQIHYIQRRHRQPNFKRVTF